MKTDVSSKQKRLKGILFDLDGTLVDSLSITLEAFNQGFLAMNADRRSDQEIMSLFGPGEKAIFAKIVGDHRAEVAYQVGKAYLESRLTDLRPFEGIPDLLSSLQGQGLRLGIFTGRGEETTKIILRHLGLESLFAAVVAHEQVQRSKPDPQGVLLCASLLGLQPNEVMHVGDSSSDILAAKSAGASSGAALWDSRVNPNALLSHRPDASFSAPLQLKNWIASHR